jgi:predicted HD superfamily hydrolase involved in NAD metabolism
VPGLEAALRARLKPGRFRHTQGVVKTALGLAKRHRINQKKAATAAWHHDCAKALEQETMKALLGAARADALERRMPPLWHAPVGAYLARREFGVSDPEILRAIRMHSTGAPGMTRLQMLLFVADYTEPGRPAWPELKELRVLAMRDLQMAYLDVLRHKMADLLMHKRPLHSRSIAAYHSALKSIH